MAVAAAIASVAVGRHGGLAVLHASAWRHGAAAQLWLLYNALYNDALGGRVRSSERSASAMCD